MTPSVTAVLPRRAKSRLTSGTWTWVPVVFLAYAFLYDNSTSMPTALGAEWTQLTELPREIRIVEAISLILATLVVLNSSLSRLSRNLLIAISLFTAVGVGSQMTRPLVSLLDAFRLIYAYISPLFIFIIGREGRLNRRSRDLIMRFCLVWIVSSAAISWYQFVWLVYPLGDDITGLNKDAHANGNLMFFASILLTGGALFLRKRKLFAFAIALVVTAVLSSVLKSEIFCFFALALMVWVSVSESTTKTGQKIKAGLRKRIVPVTALVVAVFVMGIAFSDLDTFNNAGAGDIITRIREEPLKFGPIASHLAAFAEVWTFPSYFLLGNGPYSYANPVSVGQGMKAGALGKFAHSSLLLQLGESSENARVTLTSSILAELGMPALLILLGAYLAIGWVVWRQRNSSDKEQVAYATGLTGCWLILILTAIVTLSGSLDTISISWPIMFACGITCRIGAADELEEQKPR